MRVLKINPGKPPIPADIDNTLEALQEAVGGYIETIHINDRLVLVCNEEGKLRQLPKNRELVWKLGEGEHRIIGARDALHGDALIVGIREDEFRSLIAREQWYLCNIFKDEEVDMTDEGMRFI